MKLQFVSKTYSKKYKEAFAWSLMPVIQESECLEIQETLWQFLAPDMVHGPFIIMCAYECEFVRCGFFKSSASDVNDHFEISQSERIDFK